MATAGEMSHLMDLQGTARARFARQLMRREERQQICLGCSNSFISTRQRERFCSPGCCVTYFASTISGHSKPLQNEELLGYENLPLQAPALKPTTQETILNLICTYCEKPFIAVKPNARFCGSKCRVYSHRKHNLG